MSEEQKLLPCPFCGGEAQTDFIVGRSYRIECHQCDAHTAHLDSEEAAIAAWNRRAAPAPAALSEEQMRIAFDAWQRAHDPRQYPAERQAFEAGYAAALASRQQSALSDEQIIELAEQHRAIINCSGTGDYGTNYDEIVPFARALLTATLCSQIGEAVNTVPPGWISVEERLPEMGATCLVLSRRSWEKSPSIKIDRWDEQYEAPLPFSSATVPIGPGWDEHGEFYTVTHWMPLPAPPIAPQPNKEGA